MKKNILILSATNNSNYTLSKDILELIDQNEVDATILSLEEYNLPLFTSSDYESNKGKYMDEIKVITNAMVQSDGLIVCAPEYNGSIPPIITNAIAWMSVSTDYWRDAFNNKIGLIASSSGGPAIKYQIAMKNQLEHLGMTVLSRSLCVSSNNPLKKDSAKKILKQLIKLI